VVDAVGALEVGYQRLAWDQEGKREAHETRLCMFIYTCNAKLYQTPRTF
jgi:hypothetical protein